MWVMLSIISVMEVARVLDKAKRLRVLRGAKGMLTQYTLSMRGWQWSIASFTTN
jgi:hypothetical protein